MTIVSNCGHDEWYRFRYGEAGDQTGDEYQLCGWYYFRQNMILRYEGDYEVTNLIVQYATSAAVNDLIGYDQADRLTFWDQLQMCGYDPALIDVPCEADCSSSTAAIIKAVGFMLDYPEFKVIPEDLYTGNLAYYLINAGFTAYTDTDMLINGVGLKAGDILLNEDEHVNIIVQADDWQPFEVDGLWGRATTRAIQDRIGVTVDGVISHQHPECEQPGFTTGWEYDMTYQGSETIRAIQRWLQSRGLYDAHIDGLCGTQTVRGLQMMCGTEVDGVISAPSDCVREIQRRLVDGTLFE